MACFHPLSCVRVVDGQSGKLAIRFSGPGEPMQVPCGQCIGCRLERKRQWACRCMHEASLHEDNCFITMTYDEDNLPVDGSLVKSHFQDFMKRLRRRNEDKKIKFFMCGEYGERLSRPHYHACLFGFDFPDKVLLSVGDGRQLFTSEQLEAAWQHKGYCTVGYVTFESAAYVAGYVTKKVTGEKKYSHYVSVDGVMLEPEFGLMSRGGRNGHGLAHGWYKKFGREVFPSDEVIMNGAPLKPPRYYQKMYQIEDVEGHEALLAKRKEYFSAHQEDSTPERLAVREKCVEARLAFFSNRRYESDTEDF